MWHWRGRRGVRPEGPADREPDDEARRRRWARVERGARWAILLVQLLWAVVPAEVHELVTRLLTGR